MPLFVLEFWVFLKYKDWMVSVWKSSLGLSVSAIIVWGLVQCMYDIALPAKERTYVRLTTLHTSSLYSCKVA